MQPTVTAPTTTEVKELIDYRLSEYCKVRTYAAQQINQRYGLLWNTIAELITNGGKRFRPYILIAAYSAYSEADIDLEGVIPAALAQELIHQAMLIHDDIIDRDTIRYGKKNIAGTYDDEYAAYINETDERAHMTQSSALLAGDILISDAYRMLSNVDVAAPNLLQAIAIFSNGIFDVVGGELLDTENAFLEPGSIKAESIARYKTAAYSFSSPLTMGATLAGVPESELRLLRQYSDHVGIAYQFRDDLLGIFGESETTGKSTSTDIIEGKRTFLIEQFDDLADETAKVAFYDIFHHPQASDDDVATARKLLEDSGAKEVVEQTIAELQDKAKAVVDQLSITEDARIIFHDIIEFCLKREK